MKLFLDDLREFPKENYECVRTYDDCVLLMKLFKDKIEVVNLDYDLGVGKTGLDVLKYMNENNICPKTIILHSTHPDGVPLMKEYVESNFKDSILLYRPFY